MRGFVHIKYGPIRLTGRCIQLSDTLFLHCCRRHDIIYQTIIEWCEYYDLFLYEGQARS